MHVNIASIGPVVLPVLTPPDGVNRRDQVVNDFNSILMEMLVRQSGFASAFASDESPEGSIVGDLMTQVLSSQLAGQFHLVTAADLFGAGHSTEARTNE
jgi:hypothetical protein